MEKLTETEINVASAVLTACVALVLYGGYRFMMWFAQFIPW